MEERAYVRYTSSYTGLQGGVAYDSAFSLPQTKVLHPHSYPTQAFLLHLLIALYNTLTTPLIQVNTQLQVLPRFSSVLLCICQHFTVIAPLCPANLCTSPVPWLLLTMQHATHTWQSNPNPRSQDRYAKALSTNTPFQ